MTETRPAYGAPATKPTTREAWEAEQLALMRELQKQHRMIEFHIEYKDGRLVAFGYEVRKRLHYNSIDDH